MSIIPLIRFLIKYRPEFFIGHLLTILPIILFNVFNFKSKFILRISGYPRLNFLRKNFLWKFFSKRIYKITCPSEDLKSQLINDHIFEKEKLFFFLILFLILINLKMI